MGEGGILPFARLSIRSSWFFREISPCRERGIEKRGPGTVRSGYSNVKTGWLVLMSWALLTAWLIPCSSEAQALDCQLLGKTTWLREAVLNNRRDLAMAYHNAARQRVFLFGGYGEVKPVSDTWSLLPIRLWAEKTEVKTGGVIRFEVKAAKEAGKFYLCALAFNKAPGVQVPVCGGQGGPAPQTRHPDPGLPAPEGLFGRSRQMGDGPLLGQGGQGSPPRGPEVLRLGPHLLRKTPGGRSHQRGSGGDREVRIL